MLQNRVYKKQRDAKKENQKQNDKKEVGVGIEERVEKKEIKELS